MITALDKKYRPGTLDEVIGQDAIVTQLKGIVKSGKWPSAIAFFGPTSAGKTTLARALAASAFGIERVPKSHSDYAEHNAADAKTKEDVNGLIALGAIRPQQAKRRFVFLDEAQGLLSNAHAAGAFLKPLEEPPAHLTWIIGSMDPSKFDASSNGRAILGRCTCFHLKAPSTEDLVRQAKRIRKGEGMTYLTADHLQRVAEVSDSQFRVLANVMQSLQAYYEGLEDKPETLDLSAIEAVASTVQPEDATIAVRFLTALYAGSFRAAQKEVLGVADGFSFIGTLLYMNWYVLNTAVLDGKTHPKVWGNKASKVLVGQIDERLQKLSVEGVFRIEAIGLVQAALTTLKAQSQTFAVKEEYALSQFALQVTTQLKALYDRAKKANNG